MHVHSTGRRPGCVTLFSLLVLLLGSGLNLARGIWAARYASTLADLSLSTAMPMSWLAATSLLWGLAFGVCGVALWRLRPRARMGTMLCVALFHGHIWLNHVFFDRSDYAVQAWPFSIVQTMLALVIVWGFLNWPSIQRLYREQGQSTLSEDKK